MSGSGRKTTYRKGVTKKVLYGDPEPKENEQIVRVVALRGSNLFEVQHADNSKSVTMLPTKFRKLIWVKRGDYLIVAEGDGEATTAKGTKGAVTSIVEHILYKDQIKNLKNKNLWPAAFDQETKEDSNGQKDDKEGQDAEVEETGVASTSAAQTTKGITMLETNFADFHINRNRRKGQFDEDEEEDDDEDEDDN